MAVFSAILVPAQASATKIAALAASTSSLEQSFGSNQIIALNATGDINIKFGPAGLGAAAVTDFRIPANVTMTFDLGRQWTSVRIFNPSASATVDVYIQPLSKF